MQGPLMACIGDVAVSGHDTTAGTYLIAALGSLINPRLSHGERCCPKVQRIMIEHQYIRTHSWPARLGPPVHFMQAVLDERVSEG